MAGRFHNIGNVPRNNNANATKVQNETPLLQSKVSTSDLINSKQSATQRRKDHDENLSKDDASMKSKQKHKDQMETLSRLLEVGNLNMSSYMKAYGLKDLPPWSHIEHSYGSEPTILGLETCTKYRSIVPNSFERWVAPTGLFHSGTNLMAGLLAETCMGMIPNWQVPWGKHNPVSARQESHRAAKDKYKAANNTQVLPIVMVRHPIDWMPSMCRQSYAASYNHSKSCPGLGANEILVKLYKNYPYPDFLRFWMDWNRPYILKGEANFPRLVVRLEDLVYYPKATLQQVCTCIGGYFRASALGALHDRQGGNVRKAPKDTLQIVEAWKRHSNVSLQNLAQQDQQVVLAVSSELQPLFNELNYKLQ